MPLPLHLHWTDSTSAADWGQGAALSVFKKSLGADSTFLANKWRVESNCNVSLDLVCSRS